MDEKKIMSTLKNYKNFLEEKGYNVIYIGLYGSQNYNLDDEQSDVDARAIVIPKLRDIIERKSISRDYEFETGKVDVKDLYTYYGVIKKGNFSFIEPFHTKWYIGDKILRENFGKFQVNHQALVGAMNQKLKNMVKYIPGEKAEYDAKNFHHIRRLEDLLNHLLKYNDGKSFLEYDWCSKMTLPNKREKNVQIGIGWFGYANKIVNDAFEKVKIPQKIEQPQLDDWIADRITKEVKKECLKRKKKA